MAFCMSKNSRKEIENIPGAQRPDFRKDRQSKSQVNGKPPKSTSPILQTKRQIMESQQRDAAARQILGYRKKKSFVIKTSIQQTRFSKKDIKDLKDRFEKNSTWVLVNELGETLDAEGRVLNYVEQQAQHQKQFMVEYHHNQHHGKGSSNPHSANFSNNNSQSHKSDSTQSNPKQSLVSSQYPMKASPSTSFTNEKGPVSKGFVKGGNYKKIEISLDQQEPIHLGIHYVRKMAKNQFRNCMGLLGLESNAFLSNRIFEVVDSDHDQYITFAQFATIMDTLINGEEDEKHEFSFSLLDLYDAGYFNLEEFTEIIQKFVAHWCIITGSSVKVEKEGLREIFNGMDHNSDGIVDLDDYKQALKRNPQLFQWFDLLNSGMQDGKKSTQKEIVDMKVKALTDVLELQQKLNTVMSQMKHLETSAVTASASHYLHRPHLDHSQLQNHNYEYESSSQYSNFGSSMSKNKRNSFKIEDFNMSIQQDLSNENFKLHKQNQRKAQGAYNNSHPLKHLKSIEIEDNNREKSALRKILDGNENFSQIDTSTNERAQQYQIGVLGISSELEDFDKISLQDQVISQVFPKKALKKDSEEYHLYQMRKQMEIQKLRKKEFGEKKTQIFQPMRKPQETQDEEVIDDPDSPDVHKFSNNASKTNKRPSNQSALSQREEVSSQFVYHLFGKNSHQLVPARQNPQSSQALNSAYQSRSQRETNNLPRTVRQDSNNSNNSQMKPENQQSSGVNSSSQSKVKLQGQSRNQMAGTRTQNLGISLQSNNPTLTISQNVTSIGGYMSDWSPNNGVNNQDTFNHQGGGPQATPGTGSKTHRPISSQVYELKNESQLKLSKSKNKAASLIDDIISDNSAAYRAHTQTEELKQQQQQIMTQLNDIQSLANHLLSSLQEDKNSEIGQQVKEYVQKEQQKILKRQSQEAGELEENKDDKEDQMFRFSMNQDDGNLRPLNEIQSFFRVRSRQRLHESIKKASHIHKPLSKGSNKSFIHIGHDNWNLVLHMMLGIRQSVRNVMHEEVFELDEQDFERKYCYELIAKKTKQMNLFEFYDFSPRVFQLIRTMYGITPDQYLKSIGPENLIGNLLMGNISSLKEQCSTGKSGSFFYYTADMNFMLKTISQSEFHNLREILKDYYNHLAIYPHTLITRFFGLHKIKYSKENGGKARIYFVIMANVFKTSREIHQRFDLKGSTQGRRTKKNPNEYIDPSVALKDLDFLDERIKVKVSPDIQKALTQQMQDDVKIFQRLNINDYSLLLGIHYLQDEDEGRQILQSSPSIHQIIRNSFDVNQSREKLIGDTYKSQNLLRPPMPFYEAHDGGIVSTDGKCVYFIGIIDTLTYFGAKKKLEYSLKTVAYGNKTISCIPPKNYGDRFIGFMSTIFE